MVPTEATATVPPTAPATVPPAAGFYYGVLQLASTVDDIRSPERLAHEMQRTKALGANLVAQVFPPELSPDDWRTFLDVAQQEELFVLGKIGPGADNPDPTDLSPILNILRVVGDHPALYGYIYLHEPWEEFDNAQMLAMYREIKAAYPHVRLGVFWSGEIGLSEQRGNSNQRFTDGLCDVCIVNLKPFQSDPTEEERQGLGRMRDAASVILERDSDAEIWSSAQVWSRPGGGRRGFRVPSPDEMETLFCTLRRDYPLRGFLWETWTIDKPNEGTLASAELRQQREAMRRIYDSCVHNQ
jgi:hypothetical protein